MAKINHNDFNDTVNDILYQAKVKEVMHLEFEGDKWTGKEFDIGAKSLVNFGTSGYLGMETHPKMIEGAKKYIELYGTQFSISRAFVDSRQVRLLEDKLSEIFGGHKTVVFSSTTLAHISIIPILMSSDDAIVVDQQAHLSMQTAIQLMSNKGATVTLIRHNNTEMLERKIIELSKKHKKVWYVIDGVYSMYGDLAPYKELQELSDKYSQLHFYIDDAHGMSWYGERGSGCAYNFFNKNKKTILVSTMAKGFGSTGGIAVFPDEKTYHRISVYGGPLSYSHPISPGVIGASIASANIHLSSEINKLQASHREKMNYCNELLENTDIPVISKFQSPIYFLGTGQPKVGFNLNKRILNEGFYVNLGIFPAVSMKNTGLRFSITNHVTPENIKDFVEALNYHYPKALEEEGRTNNQIRKAFKFPLLDKTKEEPQQKINENLSIEVHDTIEKIDRDYWNNFMGDRPNCSWESLKMTEDAYSNNDKEEENAQMLYYFVKNGHTGKVICCTFFTFILMKDDMFEQAKKSKAIEVKREDDPYFLTSKMFFMGSMLSIGDHIYFNGKKENLNALELILEDLQSELVKRGGNGIILRDFEEGNQTLNTYFYDYGFTKITMPNSNQVELELPFSDESLMKKLSSSSKKNFKRYIKKKEKDYNVEFKPVLEEAEIDDFRGMQENIRKRNYSINIFQYPKRIIEEMNKNTNYEFILLSEKDSDKHIAIGCCHIGLNIYSPILLGMSDMGLGNKVYHQMLYQAVKRAGYFKLKYVYLGLSADEAKKDVGAKQVPKTGYIYLRDNFNLEAIETIGA